MVCGAGGIRPYVVRAWAAKTRARSIIDEALQLAPTAKNDSQTTAAALNFLGDSYFYRGDYTSARQQYEKALQLATKAKVPRPGRCWQNWISPNLTSRRAAAQSAVAALKKLKQDADIDGPEGGLGACFHLSGRGVAGDESAGRGARRAGQCRWPRRETWSAGGPGTGTISAGQRARALAARTAEAIPHYRQAVNILESVSKEDGASRVLDRSDLKDVYREAAKGYQGAG